MVMVRIRIGGFGSGLGAGLGLCPYLNPTRKHHLALKREHPSAPKIRADNFFR